MAYKRDHYDIERYEIVDSYESCSWYTYTNSDGETEEYESCTTYYIRDWVPSGSTSHRYRVSLPYRITASAGNTAISPASGSHTEGRESLTWRTTGLSSSTVNNFTLTVTAPGGKTWKATDSCTVFIPRGISLAEIQMMDNYVYAGNKQIAFVHVSNLRDVGEEKVTLKYRMGNQLLKTETLILPSGPAGKNKGIVRAFEFTPWLGDVTLTVDAQAPALPNPNVPERAKTLSAKKTKTYRTGRIGPTDLKAVRQTSSNQNTLRIAYNHTNSAEHKSFINSVMPKVNYNTYGWTTTTRDYHEKLTLSVEIDSWQGTEGKGRGAW